MLNSTTVTPGINTTASLSGVRAYPMLAADGFRLEATLLNRIATDGNILLSEVDMPDVSPAGSTVVVGLAAWNTSAPSWSAMLAGRNSGTRAGVLAWPQPTANYNIVNPPLLPGLTWDSVNQDFVLLPIPEPGTFALVGAAAVVLLMLRRRNRAAPNGA